VQRTKTPTFWPTVSVWPAEPRNLPPILASKLSVSGDVITVRGLGSLAETLKHFSSLPDDFCLREVGDTDPDDVAGFMGLYGLLVSPEDELRSLPAWDLPGPHLPGEEQPADYGALLPLATETEKTASLAICKVHFLILRSMAKIVVAAAEFDEQALLDAWPSEGFREPMDAWQAWHWWMAHANAALEAFPMYVSFDEGEESRTATTYEATILQLVQVRVGAMRILRCANDRCRRPFTRQRTDRRSYDGAEHGSGVKYCSRLCAKAQSERERRARRRSEASS